MLGFNIHIISTIYSLYVNKVEMQLLLSKQSKQKRTKNRS